MKKQLHNNYKLFIFSALFCCTSVLAFSSTPPEAEVYIPPDWSISISAENDARYAIDNNDARLLGFATRGYDIPGVDLNEKHAYVKKCGIRVFDKFSDVIRNKKQLDDMKKAREYAAQYNQIILTACTLEN